MSQDKIDKMERFISLLDDYIDGKLDATQTGEIKQALKDDPFLNEVLKQHVEARANMRVAGEEEMRKKFADSFDPIPEAPNPKSNLWKILVPILLLVGLAIGAYYFMSQQQKVEEELPLMASAVDDKLLLADVEDPSYDLLRSDRDTMVAARWQSAVQAFIDKDYKNTLDTLSTLSNDSLFVNAHLGKFSLMQGVSYLKLERYDEASKSIAMIDSDNPYYDQAEWYMALVNYYAGSKAVAKTQFEKISNSNSHFKSDQAKSYLEKLSN